MGQQERFDIEEQKNGETNVHVCHVLSTDDMRSSTTFFMLPVSDSFFHEFGIVIWIVPSEVTIGVHLMIVAWCLYSTSALMFGVVNIYSTQSRGR